MPPAAPRTVASPLVTLAGTPSCGGPGTDLPSSRTTGIVPSVSEGMGDAPRLPPRSAPNSAAHQLALDLATVEPNPLAHFETDWPPFEDPVLLSLDWARRRTLIARLVALGYGLALL